MRIMVVAAEASPYAKVGGLGDVAGALPIALAALGHEIRLVMPRGQGVMPNRGARVAWRDRVRWGTGTEDVCLLAEPFPGHPAIQVRLVDAAPLAASPLYGGPDEADRYMLLADAALADLHHERWVPDVVHAQDWHASPVVLRIAQLRDRDPVYAHTKTVLTVHNMAYQGTREAGFAPWHGLPSVPAPGDPDMFSVNLLGRALAAADRVTAVSPTFAWEITTPEGGFGLDGVLAARADAVAGIVNGIDVVAFDPATDTRIPATFTAATIGGRAVNRDALAAEMGLDVAADTPIVGVVSRLVEQKGLDLLLEAAPAILDDGGRIALLGSGEAWLEDAFVDLAMANPGMVAVRIGFDAALAQRIYAGCDAFAMPSRFEPCGLGQLIAMRYGAVPLVRRTGGLADTVSPANGFLFDDPTPQALAAAFEELATVFRDPAAWRTLQLSGMAYDSSWDASARAYSDLFAELAG